MIITIRTTQTANVYVQFGTKAHEYANPTPASLNRIKKYVMAHGTVVRYIVKPRGTLVGWKV